jgi:hypothetical protein
MSDIAKAALAFVPSSPLVLFLGLSVLIILVLVVHAYFDTRTIQGRQSAETAPHHWDILARNDNDMIKRRIHLLVQWATVDHNLEISEPWLSITIPFINASMFDVTLERVDGKIRYGTTDLL